MVFRSRRYSCHVTPSTPGAAFFFKLKKLTSRSSGVTWCSRAVNRASLSRRAAIRTPSRPIPRRFPGPVSGASRVRSAFPSVGVLSSTDSAATGTSSVALFVRFLGTTTPSDSRSAFMSGFGSASPNRPPSPSDEGAFRVSRVLAHGVSTHARGLRLRGVKGQLALIATLHVAFPIVPQGRHTEGVISELNTRPVCTPVNASPGTLLPPAHDSGPGWLAKPSQYGSFIRDSMPVYPGAFGTSLSLRRRAW